jgi:hypothetical protein
MSMAQTFPAAFQSIIALMLGGLAATVVTGLRWRHRGPWRAGHLTAAALHTAALIITVVVATRFGWATPQYTVVGAQTVVTAIAMWAALLRRSRPVPPRGRQSLPDEGGQVIPMPVRRPRAGDKAA